MSVSITKCIAKFLMFCTGEISTQAGNAQAGNVPISVGAIAGIASGAIIICILFVLTVGIAAALRLLKMRAEISTLISNVHQTFFRFGKFSGKYTTGYTREDNLPNIASKIKNV